MKTRFILETVIGLIIIIAVLLFGMKGISAIALIAFFPFITRIAKIKGDEREMLIHYKTGNITFALAILFVVIIYYLQNINLGSFTVETVWMPLTIGSIIFAHGAAGMFVLFSE
jgi:hypothetical protein